MGASFSRRPGSSGTQGSPTAKAAAAAAAAAAGAAAAGRRVDKMTEGQLHEFREAFQQFDADKSGSIDRMELKALCAWVGQSTEDSEIDEMMLLADPDASGELDFWEFACLMAHKMGDVNPDKTLMSAFAIFDQNGDGTMSADELKEEMNELGEKASEEDIERVLSRIDTNNDGAVDYNEFATVMTKEMVESGMTIV